MTLNVSDPKFILDLIKINDAMIRQSKGLNSWSDNSSFKYSKAGLIDISKILNMEYNELLEKMFFLVDMISLFTGASVKTVRDPSLFDPKLAEIKHVQYHANYRKFYILEKGLQFPKYNKKELYEAANMFLSISSTMKSSVIDCKYIFRGLYDVSFDAVNAWTTPGHVFDLGDIVSTSLKKGAARNFCYEEPYGFKVLLSIANPDNIGLYVGHISKYEEEEEVVLTGKVVFDNSVSYSVYDRNKNEKQKMIFDRDQIIKFCRYIDMVRATDNRARIHAEQYIIDIEVKLVS